MARNRELRRVAAKPPAFSTHPTNSGKEMGRTGVGREANLASFYTHFPSPIRAKLAYMCVKTRDLRLPAEFCPNRFILSPQEAKTPHFFARFQI